MDDEFTNRELLGKFLEELSCRVTGAIGYFYGFPTVRSSVQISWTCSRRHGILGCLLKAVETVVCVFCRLQRKHFFPHRSCYSGTGNVRPFLQLFHIHRVEKWFSWCYKGICWDSNGLWEFAWAGGGWSFFEGRWHPMVVERTFWCDFQECCLPIPSPTSFL